MGKDVIIACDFASREATLNFLDQFTGRKPFIKIGMELYYAEGPQIVRRRSGKASTGIAHLIPEADICLPLFFLGDSHL